VEATSEYNPQGPAIKRLSCGCVNSSLLSTSFPAMAAIRRKYEQLIEKGFEKHRKKTKCQERSDTTLGGFKLFQTKT